MDVHDLMPSFYDGDGEEIMSEAVEIAAGIPILPEMLSMRFDALRAEIVRICGDQGSQLTDNIADALYDRMRQDKDREKANLKAVYAKNPIFGAF